MNEEMTLESLAARNAGDSSAPHYIAGVLREAIYRGLLPEGNRCTRPSSPSASA